MRILINRYFLSLLVIIVIIASYSLSYANRAMATLLVEETIEKAIVGQFGDLALDKHQKDLLHSFYSPIKDVQNVNNSVDLINRINNVAEYYVSALQINYTHENEVESIVHGGMVIHVEQVSLFKHNIVNIEIIEPFKFKDTFNASLCFL